MDPAANLKEQLELARGIMARYDKGADIHETDAARLAELVLALNDWITKGGFLPEQWSVKK